MQIYMQMQGIRSGPLNSELKLGYLINDLIEASTGDVNMHPTLYACKRSELITSQNCSSQLSYRRTTRVCLNGQTEQRQFRPAVT